MHALCSFLIFYCLGTSGFITLRASGLITLSVGIAKELFDLLVQHESFSLLDLSYDAIGIAIGWLLIKYIINKLK